MTCTTDKEQHTLMCQKNWDRRSLYQRPPHEMVSSAHLEGDIAANTNSRSRREVGIVTGFKRGVIIETHEMSHYFVKKFGFSHSTISREYLDSQNIREDIERATRESPGR